MQVVVRQRRGSTRFQAPKTLPRADLHRCCDLETVGRLVGTEERPRGSLATAETLNVASEPAKSHDNSHGNSLFWGAMVTAFFAAKAARCAEGHAVLIRSFRGWRRR